MNFKIMIYSVLFLLLLNIAFAQQIDVIKEYISEIKLGNVMEVKIHIYNPSSMSKEFGIVENLPGNMDVVEPSETLTKMYDGLEVKYYNWRTSVSPKSVKTITYKIKPLSLGVYVISPTEVTDISSGSVLFSNPITFNVECVPNNMCGEGENSATCPEDCSKSISDGICDYVADGVCDPDCKEEPDCKGFDYTFLIYISLIIVVLFITVLVVSRL